MNMAALNPIIYEHRFEITFTACLLRYGWCTTCPILSSLLYIIDNH